MSQLRNEENTPGGRDPLLWNAEATLDRFPLLREVFQQAADELSGYIGEMSTTPVSVFLERLGAKRIDALEGDFAFCEAVANTYVTQLETRAAIGVSRDFIVNLLELMFGSGGAEPCYNAKRPLTNIEKRIAEFALERIAECTRNAFRSFVETEFRLGPMEASADLSALGRKNHIAIFCILSMRAQDEYHRAIIAVPRAALEPFRSVLSEDYAGETRVHDSCWSHKIRHHVNKTSVTLRAIIEKPNVFLEDVVSLNVGSIIELPIGPSDRLRLDCEGKQLFWCALGQKDGRYTVRIDNAIDEFHVIDTNLTLGSR